MSIVLIDTSVLCEFIPVPDKSDKQKQKQVFAEFDKLIKHSATLLLPVATILETGRHISQGKDGQIRRQTATRFVDLVQQALQNRAPWTVSQPLLAPHELKSYLFEFPDSAMRGVSLGDLTIIKGFERQCELHAGHEVYIWSLDDHLVGYHRDPLQQWMTKK